MKFTFGLVLFVLAAVAVGNYLWPETCERPPQGVLIIGEEPAHWNENGPNASGRNGPTSGTGKRRSRGASSGAASRSLRGEPNQLARGVTASCVQSPTSPPGPRSALHSPQVAAASWGFRSSSPAHPLDTPSLDRPLRLSLIRCRRGRGPCGGFCDRLARRVDAVLMSPEHCTKAYDSAPSCGKS